MINKNKCLYTILLLVFCHVLIGQSDYLEGIVFVKVKEQQLSFFEQFHARSQIQLESLLEVDDVEQFAVQSLAKRRGLVETSSAYEVRKVFKLRFSNHIDVQSKIKSLQATGMFDVVEPSYIFEIMTYQPDDPLADSTLGSSGMNQLVMHDFYRAWTVEKGDSNVRIGVVDTGVNFDQEDSKGNLFVNINDTIDGVNNDGDTYFGDELIDNYRGWDVADWDNDPSLGPGSVHGASMISIIASTPDNDTGMVGIGFYTRYVPYKAAPDENSNSLTGGYDGMYLAALQGCKVINCSWGTTSVSPQILADITAYITLDLDAIVVAAAGNENNTKRYFPASFPTVISTSALKSDTTFAYFTSNRNYEVDVAALGHGVRQARGNKVNEYFTDQGTSAASAVVSGLAGLVRSHFPEMTALQARKQIIATGDYIDTIPGNEAYAGLMGRMINPYRALTDTVIPGLQVIASAVNGNDSIYNNAGQIVDFDVSILNLLRPSSYVSYKLTAMSDNFEFIDSLGVLEDLGTMDTLVSLGSIVQMNLFETTDSIEEFVVRIDFYDSNGYRDHGYIEFVLYPIEITGVSKLQPLTLTVHPVPFKENMVVSGNFSLDAQFHLFDLRGNEYPLVIKRSLGAVELAPKFGLETGAYIIKVTEGNRSSVVKTMKY